MRICQRKVRPSGINVSIIALGTWGIFGNRHRKSLTRLMAQEGVTSILTGARNPRQAEENAKASESELSEDTIEVLNQATEELKQKIGSNADVYQSDSRIV